MREIKFRSWDDNLMRYSHEGWDESTDVFSELWDILQSHYGHSVMQYTGLKDKNGKEIYEGDIVEINGDRSRIGWDSQFAGFYLEDLDGLLDLDEPWLFVVIGNIHENPELLESP